ncbi:MAG: itaconate CoA-transferase [Mycobacteriales bacterium]
MSVDTSGDGSADLTLPLAGTTVVSFEQAVAAPYCTRLLADLGARVIKVEEPRHGDFARHFDDAVDGLSSHFAWLNRNKLSVALDCRRPEVRPVIERLLDRTDAVVQNLAPDAARRHRLDAKTLVRDRPGLVAVDLSGYGSGGTLEHRRAYDLLAQAEAGSCATTGTADAPAKPGIPIADIGAGLHAATAILAALLRRARTGRGAALEVSLFDTATDFLGFELLHARYTGQHRPPLGMSSTVVAPYGAFSTKDGRLVVFGVTNDAGWRRMAVDLLERPDLAGDPTLATNAQRCAQRQRIDEAITAWTSTRDLDEICALADAARVGSAALNRPVDVVAHPHLTSRSRWQEVDSPVGSIASLLPPVISSDWRTPLEAVPALGSHTASVLADLGFPSDFYESLRSSGAA